MLDDLQATWARVLGGRYQKSTLVLFRGATLVGLRHGRERDGAVLLPR